MLSLEAWRDGTIDGFLADWLTAAELPAEDQQVFDHYYRSYKKHFGPYVRRWYARQTEELTGFIRNAPAGRPLRVLEVGCGCGTEALWAAVQGAEVTGIDISDDLLAVARARLDVMSRRDAGALRCDFRHASVIDFQDAPFDVIFLEQTFHHLEPRADVVEALARLVAEGGHVILSETNGWNPLIQAAMFRLRGTRTIIHHQGHVWGHERITWPFMLARYFRPHGLAPVSLDYFRVFPNVPAADRMGFVERAVPGIFKPAFTHYNMVFRKGAGGR